MYFRDMAAGSWNLEEAFNEYRKKYGFDNAYQDLKKDSAEIIKHTKQQSKADKAA